jgi:hypothetical protein
MEERLLTRILRSRLFWAGAVFAGLGILLVYASLDEAPPYDADIVCPREEVPPLENGLLLLDFAEDDFYWPERKLEVGEDEYLLTADPSDLADGSFWDAEWARDVIGKNDEILRKVDESLRLARFELPEFSTIDEALKHLNVSSLRRIRVLMAIRMRLHEEEGGAQDAIEDAVRMATLGHRIQAAHGFLFHFAFGSAVKDMGLTELRDRFQRTMSNPCALGLRAREIQHMSSREPLECSLKVEYGVVCESIDAWREHVDGVLDDGAPWIWRNAFCMKPNQTKRLYAEAVRAAVRSISVPPGSRQKIHPRGIPAWKVPRWLPYPNALGKESLKDTFRTLERMLSSQVSSDVLLSFTVALMALRCWQERHAGALPPSLDALVPEYLDEVPRDPHDGKPLRYSAEKRIVYSVGMDGKDSGGLADPDTEDTSAYEAEPTLRIESPPPGG